jgi:hypothetical protein
MRRRERERESVSVRVYENLLIIFEGGRLKSHLEQARRLQESRRVAILLIQDLTLNIAHGSSHLRRGNLSTDCQG